ncbi:MAG TPA: HAMP domain-containing sensor histidine kinase [Gemmataceae bacterium]|nr:HAMP domain-containing sensor histidine kinase [Gemmataceae bacterium]
MIASHPPDAIGSLAASRLTPVPLSRALAAGLAHHVNNPLLGVIGSLELAIRETEPESAMRDRLQHSLACAQFAAEAVRRLVYYAFHPPGCRSQVTLRVAAAAAARRFHDRGNGSGLLIRLEGEVEGRARANEPAIELVLAQLLINAREAMPDHGTVTLRVWERQEHCGLLVHDEGPGLSPTARARLFEPFFTTKGNGHLGLGLVLCRDLVESQGGSLDVASPPGGGVAVTLSLPAIGTETTLAPISSAIGPPHCIGNGAMMRS